MYFWEGIIWKKVSNAMESSNEFKHIIGNIN